MLRKPEFEKFKEKYKDAVCLEFGKDSLCPFWGSCDAKIVHISQAPSRSVIINQKPFTDKSGEKLRKDWYQVSDEVFYNPQNFYFTAVGMYFPGKDKKGGDKKPSVRFAKTWLNREIEYLSPQIFILVGALSGQFFFPKIKFTDLVFRSHEINGVLTFVLPHPSPLNIKWFKDNPEFEESRIMEIRHKIRQVL